MARFRFKSEDLKLWALVTATVRPHRASRQPAPGPTAESETIVVKDVGILTASKPKPAPLTPFKLGESLKPPSGFRFTPAAGFAPDPIEPKRKRRISRERDPIEARLDLHGMTAFAAEARLKAFVQQAWANDYRAVLVITGKGVAENGVLKRNAPEWLADPQLAHIVAGISPAHARHGGAGALYVAFEAAQLNQPRLHRQVAQGDQRARAVMADDLARRQMAEPGAGLDVQVLGQAEHHPGGVLVAGAGGIDHACARHRRHAQHLVQLGADRTGRPARHERQVDLAFQVADRP